MATQPSLPIYPLQLVTEEHRAFITYLPPAVPNALETTHYLYTDSVVNYLGYLIPKKTKRCSAVCGEVPPLNLMLNKLVTVTNISTS